MAGKKRKGKEDLLSRRRREVLDVLSQLGIRKQFLKIDPRLLNGVCLNRCPAPRIKFDKTAGSDRHAQEIADRISRKINEVKIQLPSTNIGFNLKTFFSTFCTIRNAIEYYRRGVAHEQLLNEIRSMCEFMFSESAFTELCGHAVGTLAWHVDDVLVQFTRFDEHLFYHQLEHNAVPRGRGELEINIFKDEPRRFEIDIDGDGVRPVYQCGAPYALRATDWVCWLPKAMGYADDLAELPVCVQNHALRQFNERVSVSNDDNAVADSIYHSLRKPYVAKRNNNDLLVEYNLWDKKIGYWVVRFTGSMFVVRTFLFLTMQGTPEAENLYRRLRKNRAGVEIMMLDRLSTFVLGDICTDVALCEILTECGCGHLFEWAKKISDEHRTINQARNIRRYLGMANPENPAS